MKVGDLVVNIIFKGAGDAEKASKKIQVGLSDVKSMALETKAAIAAIVYEIGKMVTSSIGLANDILNVSTETGAATKELQQWSNAAEKAGGSAEALRSSVSSVQKAFSGTGTTEGGPEFLKWANSILDKIGVGAISEKETTGAQNGDIFPVLQKLVALANAPTNVVPTAIQNKIIEGLGAGAILTPARRGAFAEANIAAQPYLSRQTLEENARLNAKIKYLEQMEEQGTAKLTAKANKLEEELKKSFEEERKKQEKIKKTIDKKVQTGELNLNGDQFSDPRAVLRNMQEMDRIRKETEGIKKQQAHPPVKPIQHKTEKKVQNDVSVHLNFQHPGENALETADSVKTAINQAYRQMSAQGQVT